jgi:hypothetical protein
MRVSNIHSECQRRFVVRRENDLTILWSRTAALWSAVVKWVRRRLTLARASKNYGRAKRMAWDVLVAVAATTITALLTGLLHGR